MARNLTVVPNGEERLVVHNERLEHSAAREVSIPEEAIPDASKIFVKFYPGALSQMVEGLDSILRMPGGCFEQTSSSTYPNVLVLDYLKTSKKLTPEIQAKAEGYISLGYQKLVTFEVKGGGFSWFGNDPANKILTAYGLMEFSDMSRVHEVDPRVIERTQAWLASQQQPDGSFKPDTYFINEGATTRYNTDLVRITAYIGWALASTGYKGEAVEKAKQYVRSHVTGKEDAYTLAVIANFAADSAADKGWTESAVGTLASKASDDGKLAFWKQEGETPTSAREDSADLETTALAVQALLKSGQGGGLAKKGLDYLTSKKDALGNWQTTQATILALKAFLLSHTRGSNTDTEGTINVSVDGRPAGSVQVTRDNNDLLHLVDLKQFTHTGANRIALSFAGRGSMQYQIVGRYYVPWSRVADGGGKGRGAEPLSIDLAYDRTRLAQDETVTTRVRVQNNTAAKAKMVMIDLGIPPGFEPLGEDFAELLDTTRGKLGGKIEKYTITAKQVILYLDGLNARQIDGIQLPSARQVPLARANLPVPCVRVLQPRLRRQHEAVNAGRDREVEGGLHGLRRVRGSRRTVPPPRRHSRSVAFSLGPRRADVQLDDHFVADQVVGAARVHDAEVFAVDGEHGVEGGGGGVHFDRGREGDGLRHAVQFEVARDGVGRAFLAARLDVGGNEGGLGELRRVEEVGVLQVLREAVRVGGDRVHVDGNLDAALFGPGVDEMHRAREFLEPPALAAGHFGADELDPGILVRDGESLARRVVGAGRRLGGRLGGLGLRRVGGGVRAGGRSRGEGEQGDDGKQAVHVILLECALTGLTVSGRVHFESAARSSTMSKTPVSKVLPFAVCRSTAMAFSGRYIGSVFLGSSLKWISVTRGL